MGTTDFQVPLSLEVGAFQFWFYEVGFPSIDPPFQCMLFYLFNVVLVFVSDFSYQTFLDIGIKEFLNFFPVEPERTLLFP